MKRPDLCRPRATEGSDLTRTHASEARVQVLVSVVVEVEEDDAVPLLRRAQTLQHGRVGHRAGAPDAVALPHVEEVR